MLLCRISGRRNKRWNEGKVETSLRKMPESSVFFRAASTAQSLPGFSEFSELSHTLSLHFNFCSFVYTAVYCFVSEDVHNVSTGSFKHTKKRLQFHFYLFYDRWRIFMWLVCSFSCVCMKHFSPVVRPAYA